MQIPNFSKKTILILFVTLCISVNVFGESQGEYRTIPIYPRGKGPVTLAADVKEVQYSGDLSYKSRKGQIIQDEMSGAPSAEAVVAEYIDAILTQNNTKLSMLLYDKSTEAIQKKEEEMKALEKMLKGVSDLQFVRKWSFGDYNHVFLNVIPSSEHLYSWSFETVHKEGRYYLVQEYTKTFNNVLMLFWYMDRNARENLIQASDYSALENTLTVTPPDSSIEGKNNVLKIRLNIRYYNNPETAWQTSCNDSLDQASDFFCRAKRISLEGNDQEFLSLWNNQETLKLRSQGEDKIKIDQDLIENHYEDFKRFRHTYRKVRFSEQPFKQVANIDLGQCNIHYYVEKNTPEKLKYILMKNVNNQYYLTEGLYSNVRNFLTTEAFTKPLLSNWQ